MTDSQCWIEYRNDERTSQRNAEGWYGPPSTVKATSIPGPCPKNGYWPTYLEEWCSKSGIEMSYEMGRDGSQTTRARVSKQQIQGFISFMYDDLPQFNDPKHMSLWKGRANSVHLLIDLKVFVAKEFSDGIVYEICADTW